MILMNVARFADNCLSYSLKLVVDQVKGKCTQFPLCQPASSSSKDSHATRISPSQLPQNHSQTELGQRQKAGDSTGTIFLTPSGRLLRFQALLWLFIFPSTLWQLLLRAPCTSCFLLTHTMLLLAEARLPHFHLFI